MFCNHQQLLQSKDSKQAFLEFIQMFSQKLLLWQLIKHLCNARLTFDVANLSTEIQKVFLELLSQSNHFMWSQLYINHTSQISGRYKLIFLYQIVHK